jgi:hypothetical protein
LACGRWAWAGNYLEFWDMGLPLEFLNLCYEAEAKVYSAQETSMTGVRTRAVALLTIASFVLSFSAGVGLIRSSKDGLSTIPPTEGRILVIIVAIMAALVVWIVLPTQWLPSPRANNFGYQERLNDTEANEAHGQNLALQLGLNELIRAVSHNEDILRQRSRLFTCCAVLFCLELVIIAWVIFS